MPAATLRSIDSTQPAYPTFLNGTSRRVDIVWLDFQGAPVVYKTLKPRETFRVTTFVTHPWLFVDADTRDLLLGRLKYVYMPEAPKSRPIKRHTVMITVPVFPLLARALQVLRNSLKPEIKKICLESEKVPDAIKGLGLPHTLQIKLMAFIKSSQELKLPMSSD
ncbi:Hypothetical predicted protein [Cloeon dipterum]|uniref:von Hippel-Lindau disease tumour suppressor beta domain-containing protein n=1 Tax=Cloeon dipterum TaxID=197152 RepID=A0A8S1CIU9_9INSE|nr:Hypothetical predicted protein [Cloeon dipterum]